MSKEPLYFYNYKILYVEKKATLVIFYTFVFYAVQTWIFFIAKPGEALGLSCIIKQKFIKMKKKV